MDYWLKQGKEAYFQDLVWSRPEMKQQAGKLLIIGGNGQSFAGAAETFMSADRAGVGTIRTLLPQSIAKTVSKLFPEAEFMPSNLSGSFASQALAEFIDAATWADGVVIAADTGNNSETSQLFESFFSKYNGQLTLVGDIVDTFIANPQTILNRPETCLSLDFSQLQKLATNAKYPAAFTSDMGLMQLVERLHDFSSLHASHFIIEHGEVIFVAADDRISTTKNLHNQSASSISAPAAVWWLQNPAKPFEAITTSIAV